MAHSFDHMEIWILQELLDRYERSSLFRDQNLPSAESGSGKDHGFPPESKRSGGRRIQLRVDSVGKLNELLEDADRRKEFLHAAQELKRKGLIDYAWVKYETGNLIDRIWLMTEQDRLMESYRLCRRVGKQQQILGLEKQIRAALDHMDPEGVSDIQDFLKQMLLYVREHRSVPRFFFHGENTPESTQLSCEKNESLLRFLVVLSQNEGELQERVVSTRLYGDSKYFERELKSKVVSILRDIDKTQGKVHTISGHQWNEAVRCEAGHGDGTASPALLKSEVELPDEKSSEELLEERGIVRWPEVLEFCGRIQLILENGQEIPYQNQIFGAYVNSDTVRHAARVKLDGIARIITIENKANYVWYLTNHRKADELVLFHGGVFSPVKGQWMKLIAEAAARSERSISCRHWSDIDVGGFRIFLRLKKEIFPAALPAFMDVKTLERFREKCMYIKDESYMALIGKMRENPEYEMFHDVLDYMAAHNVRLEQENEI